jgi:hypothetical protein
MPRKENLYPLYRRLGGSQGLPGWVQKISPLPGFNPWTVQPIASHYTDYTIPSHKKIMIIYTKLPQYATVAENSCQLPD